MYIHSYHIISYHYMNLKLKPLYIFRAQKSLPAHTHRMWYQAPKLDGPRTQHHVLPPKTVYLESVPSPLSPCSTPLGGKGGGGGEKSGSPLVKKRLLPCPWEAFETNGIQLKGRADYLVSQAKPRPVGWGTCT